MDKGIPVEQHTVGRSLLLHLGPGVLIGACYFALAPLLGRAGYPSFMALMIAIPVVLVPVELGYLLCQGRKRNGRWSLAGVVFYRTPIPVWQYFVWVPGLFIVVGAIFTLLKPVDTLLHQQVFAWLPTLQSGLEGGFGRTPLILTYAMVAAFGAFAGPIVEELYFRGYLLPRMGYAGKWAPALHSLLFAVYHVWTPWQFVTRTFGVLPLVYAAQRRNLYLSMIVHVLVNLLDVATGVAFILAMRA